MKGETIKGLRNSLDAGAKSISFLRRRASSTFNRQSLPHPAPAHAPYATPDISEMSEQSHQRISIDVPWWRTQQGGYVNVRATDFIDAPTLSPRPAVVRPRPPSIDLSKLKIPPPTEVDSEGESEGEVNGNAESDAEDAPDCKAPDTYCKDDAERLTKLEAALEEAGLRRVISKGISFLGDNGESKPTSLPVVDLGSEARLDFDDRPHTSCNDVLWPRPERPSLVTVAKGRGKAAATLPQVPDNRCFYPSPPALPTPPASERASMSERASFVVDDDVPYEVLRNSMATADSDSTVSESSFDDDDDDDEDSLSQMHAGAALQQENDSPTDDDDASCSSHEAVRPAPQWNSEANASMTSSVTSRGSHMPGESPQSALLLSTGEVAVADIGELSLKDDGKDAEKSDSDDTLVGVSCVPKAVADERCCDDDEVASSDEEAKQQLQAKEEAAAAEDVDDEQEQKLGVNHVDVDMTEATWKSDSESEEETLSFEELRLKHDVEHGASKSQHSTDSLHGDGTIQETESNDTTACDDEVCEDGQQSAQCKAVQLNDSTASNPPIQVALAAAAEESTDDANDENDGGLSGQRNFVRNATPLPLPGKRTPKSRGEARRRLGGGMLSRLLDPASPETAAAAPMSPRRRAARARRFSSYGARLSKGALAHMSSPPPRRPDRKVTPTPAGAGAGGREFEGRKYDHDHSAAVSVASSDEEFVPDDL